MSVILASISLLISLSMAPMASTESFRNGFTLERLPEYVVIRSDESGSAITITIDYRKSKYHSQLEALEEYLSHRKKRNVRNQSELLSVMSEVGFDYVNAYPIDTEDMVNVVFRKKEAFRK